MAFFTILNQVFILFLLMAVGFLIFRFGMIDETGVRQFTSVLCYIVSPSMIIYAFQMQFSPKLMVGLLIATFSSIAIHIFSIIAGRVMFNKKTVGDEYKRTVMRFAAVYTNSGFMGLPLLQAIAGTRGLFYGAAYNGIFNLFSWSHGIMTYSGKTDKKSLVKAIANPNIIAVLVGVLLFRFSIQLPGPIYLSVKYISNLNTPLSMLIIGTSISQIPLKSIFVGKLAWIMVFLRNLVLPFVLLFALHALGVSGELLLCCVIPVACPVAGATVLFAKLVGKDTSFPAKLVTITTITSIISIPLLVYSINALKF
jgi:predicted permease